MIDELGAPSSIDAEQALLGGLMFNNAAWDDVAELVTAADFYRADHRLIFSGMAEISKNGQPFDPVTIADAVAIEDWAYVVSLARSVGTAANVRQYAAIVRDRALDRKMLIAADDLGVLAREHGDAGEKLDRAAMMIAAISDRRSQGGAQTVREMLPAWIDNLQAAMDRGGGLTGLATGFEELDNKLSGLCPSDLIIIAARPSMGKTSLGMNIAENVALAGKKVLVFSMEMSKDQLLSRSVSSTGGIDFDRIRRAALDDDDMARMMAATGRLIASGLSIDDSAALTVLDLRARARRAARAGLDLIVVDYLGLMTGKGENKNLEVGAISAGLKALAKELKIPVLVLAQLNRGLEQRADKRPVMSDLRDSGAIEQDADVILMIYRDEVYNDQSAAKGTAEILIRKQRQGALGTVRLNFQGRFCRFENHTGPDPDDAPREPERPRHDRGFQG